MRTAPSPPQRGLAPGRVRRAGAGAPRYRNETCPCPGLAQQASDLLDRPDGELLLVAPALNSRMRHWVSNTDEAIHISTHPAGQSHLLERGLLERAREELTVPILHLESRYGLLATVVG